MSRCCQLKLTLMGPTGLLEDRLDSADPAIGLAAVVALRDLADEIEAAHFADARQLGWSWQSIGRALGIPRQSVHKKYAGSLPR